MKKRYLFLLTVALISSLELSAQITIVTGDLPSANDTFRVSTAQPFTGMDETLTGANYSWDYSQLVPDNQTIDTFMSVSSTNLTYALVFANVSFNPYRSNLATPGASITNPFFPVTDVFNFYYNSSTAYSQTGFGGSISGIPVPTTYSPRDRIYPLPLNFNDQDTSFSAFEIDLNSTLHFYYSGQRHRETIVDGWGSLTTPFGTFNTLRVKSIINEHDSIHIDTIITFGYGIDLPEVIEYKWLGTGEGIPLLQINTSGGAVTQIIYRDSLRSVVGIDPLHANDFDFSVFPNPFIDNIFVNFSLRKNADVEISLYDLAGRKMCNKSFPSLAPGASLLNLDVHEFIQANGTYSLVLKVDDIEYVKKIVLQH